MIVVERWADAPAHRRERFAELLEEYHRRTEHEKLLGREPRPEDSAPTITLPDRYRVEITDPSTAFASEEILLAVEDDRVLGCAVLTDGPSPELKRLWVAPDARRRGVAATLLEAATTVSRLRGDDTVRLSVWHWRSAAIALYRRSGFVAVASWDGRPGLDCFVRTFD
ncbi:putative acetyltransferase [Plantibacter flavus]|uniref:Putative acetyltransferase n=1 Tax=Plantibacter flavus TaxID=150123 RepID=A0A3N2C621_9MICO|nr:GNAT family N-acetyltransferase [Plantibacter flavus]ROR82946.1 putative acetyltransferase [Plantibacter flavus]SMG47627.1 putative acetyltransferase [Plantibacter flavus]